MFITAQTFILNIVIMVLDLMERGGHVLRGVTAHGSPGRPLQFDRLEAAFATTFHMKAARQKLGGNDVRIRNNRYVGDYLLDYLYREESLSKLQDEHSQPSKLGLRRFYLGVMVGVCCIRKLGKRTATRCMPASIRKWPSHA
jgi:hypothetical protein